MHNKTKKQKKKYAVRKALYNFDGERFVQTIHERHDSRYAGSPGAPIINLSDKFDPTVTDVFNVDDNNDNMSDMTNLSQLSKGELIEDLKDFQTLKTSRDTDSASENINQTLLPVDGAEDDSQDESRSSSSSSESSDENHSNTDTAPSG